MSTTDPANPTGDSQHVKQQPNTAPGCQSLRLDPNDAMPLPVPPSDVKASESHVKESTTKIVRTSILCIKTDKWTINIEMKPYDGDIDQHKARMKRDLRMWIHILDARLDLATRILQDFPDVTSVQVLTISGNGDRLDRVTV